MHNSRSGHLDAVYHILRYLKGCPGHLIADGYNDADWVSCLDDRRKRSTLLKSDSNLLPCWTWHQLMLDVV